MHRLNPALVRGSALAMIMGLGLATASCSSSSPTPVSCEYLSEGKLRQGTAIEWAVGETKYLGYGIFECDSASTVKVEVEDDVTGSYTFTDVLATFGPDQMEFGNLTSDLKDSKTLFESVQVLEKDTALELEPNQKVQLFVGAQPTLEALFYGVERHRITVTFYSIDGKVIDVFRPSNDIGILAKLPKTK